jgi:glutamyl-tRNA reductase
LDAIRARAALHGEGAAVVASCQRIEVFHQRRRCLCGAGRRWEGRAALARLAEVAAGLHSIVLGEAQILGQVRSAFAHSGGPTREHGDLAIAAARALRRESRWDVDSGLLLDRALRVAARDPGGSLLVAGAGSMGRLVARRALALGFHSVAIAARRPLDFATAGLAYVPLAALRDASPVDVIVTCLGSEAREIPAAGLPAASLVIDLGTPRNTGGTFESAQLVTITDLAALTGAEDAPRRDALCARLAVLLDARIADRGNGGTPLGRLWASVERTRQAENARTARLHPDLPPETIDAITRSLANHLFHPAAMRLRRLGDPEFEERIVALLAAAPEPEGVPYP